MTASAPDSEHLPLPYSSLERRWLLSQTRLLEQLARGAPSEEVFQQLLDSVAALIPDMPCSILLRDQLNNTLYPLIQSQSLPQFYVDALSSLPIAVGVGSCGTAASTGKRVIVEDIASHPYWAEYQELASRAGLAACWSHPICSESGIVVGTFGMYYDHPRAPNELELLLIEGAANLAGSVLARDRHLQDIIERERRYRTLVENLPVAIHEIDVNGRMLWVNPAGAKMFNVSELDTTRAHYFLDEIHKADHKKVQHAFDQACAGNVGEYTFRDKSEHYFRGNSVPLLSSCGEVERIIGIVENVTERTIAKRALQQERDLLEHRVKQRTFELEEAIDELRNLETDLNTIIDASPDPLFILDTDAILRRVNTPVVEALGYTRDEILGRDVGMLAVDSVTAKDKALRATFYQAIADGSDQEMTFEVTAKTRQGNEIPMEVRASPIELSGERFFALAARDITAHLARAEALRSLTTKAERATTAKATFLAAISHDLAQPLQSVGLYLSVLNKQLSSPQALRVAGNMRSSLDVMTQLLEALLDLANLESGVMTANYADLAIDPILRQIEAACQPQAEQKSLRLTVDSSDAVVHTDLGLLNRILTNLVSNAINYTEQGEVHVALNQRAELLDIAVQDTGSGIPSDKLEEIFDEYVQVHNPVRERRKGLGLGLAIVKHVARILSCPVTVSSVVGEGSTFQITIPLASSQIASSELKAASPVEIAAQTANLLLIEDDHAVAMATNLLLQTQKFKVHTARTGEEALQLVRNAVRPDAILSDYGLPGENGVIILKQLRAVLGSDIPCVFLTGDPAAAKKNSAGLINTHVFSKPVLADDLLTLVRQILR